MQLTIAVCDDNPIQLNIVVSCIKSLDIKWKVEILHALSGKELLNKLEKKRVDVAFLDIEGIDGIGLARKILKKYKDCIIAFITGFKDYALEAFNVDAFDYILKPITEKRFKKSIENIILRLKEKRAFKETNNVFTINNKNHTVKIKYGDIFYFEKLLNKIKVYTSKGEYEYYGSLKNLKKELDMEKGFIQCHQGYILSIPKILELRNEEVYIRDIEKLVPVSRRYKKKVRKILEENLFCKI